MNATSPEKPTFSEGARPVPASGPAPAPAPRKSRRIGLMLSVPLLLVLAGGGYWLTGGRYESTENAYLHQARIGIASDLSGRVVSVAIEDNAPVTAGDLLFQVDPEPYRLKLAEAEAALDAARLGVQQLKVAYRQALTQAELAEDDAAYQQTELDRQLQLSAKGVTATTSLDDARHLAQRADELRAVAKQGVANALAALGGDPAAAIDSHPSVLAALVARDRARYDLELTTVRAPADGVIYKASSFKVGQFVAAGQDLFALVETGDSWIEANFKETQLDGIRVGQPAEVTFDAAPGKPVMATVEAIGAGTGAEFSLLPAQNATGNWVKVTQRVPVRLHLDEPLEQGLASGMSASVSVDTGRHRALASLLPTAWAAE